MIREPMNERVRKGLPFNCPSCGSAIGSYCTNKRNRPMARFIHPDRTPFPVTGKFDIWRMQNWLGKYGSILTDIG